MEYELNKGIGQSAEFKGLKAQYLFIFAGGLLALFVVFVVMYMARRDVHGRNRPMGVHHLRRGIRIGLGVAHLPPEREVRRTRTDETARQAAAPALPD